jgi:hypothetical protein
MQGHTVCTCDSITRALTVDHAELNAMVTDLAESGRNA